MGKFAIGLLGVLAVVLVTLVVRGARSAPEASRGDEGGAVEAKPGSMKNFRPQIAPRMSASPPVVPPPPENVSGKDDDGPTPGETAAAVIKERERVSSVLTISGASDAEWTHHARREMDTWIESLDPSLRGVIISSSWECYEAGCMAALSITDRPGDVVDAIDDGLRRWSPQMRLGVEEVAPGNSRTAIVFLNPTKPFPAEL